jgi:hypothetical protein
MRKSAIVFNVLLVVPALAAAPSGDPVPANAMHLKQTMQDVTEFDVALSPLQVDAFYRHELAKRGWKIGDTVSYGTTLVLDARKPPKGAGRVTIAPIGPGKTHVTVSFTE